MNEAYDTDERIASVRSIHLNARRWFQRGPGNTYHSVTIYVNGKRVFHIPFSYGGGNMFAQNAADWLERNGYVKLQTVLGGTAEQLWRYAERNDITFQADVTDVARKKDL